jgi:hypothetical protein
MNIELYTKLQKKLLSLHKHLDKNKQDKISIAAKVRVLGLITKMRNLIHRSKQ